MKSPVGRIRALLVAAPILLALALAGAPDLARAAFVIFGAHAPSLAPAVNSASFTVSLPLTTGQAVGTATATNIPTSWSITGCSPSCSADFAVSSGGAITLTSTGASALTAAAYTLTVQATNAYGSGSNTNSVTVNSGASYVGLLDQYSSLPATQGWSNHALTKAYADGGGHFAVIHRQSDGTTVTINFDSGYLADVSTFTGFGCSDANPCYVDTQYDQTGNGLNETCTNVRIFVAASGRLARAPQGGGKCVVAYSATFATAIQEMLAVGAPGAMDNNLLQSGIPGVQVTGNVTNGSGSISSMSRQAGISAASNYTNQPTFTGVSDSANCLPSTVPNGHTFITALPSGSTATIGVGSGSESPSCTQAGDTLTFKNAVLGGVWWANGPTSGGFASAYWAYGISVNSISPYAGDTAMRRSGATYSTNNSSGASVGNGMRKALAVWDIESQTGSIYFNGTKISNTIASGNITYSTNVQLTKYQAPNGGDQLQNAVFEQEVLTSAVQTGTNRTAIASWLMTQFSLTDVATTFTTTDGFALATQSLQSYPLFDSKYGSTSITDPWGVTWYPTSGGYSWPSIGYATNINNGGAEWVFKVHAGDSDQNNNQSERAEVDSNATIAPGQVASMFAQFRLDDYSTHNGDWFYLFQIHNNNATSSPPDIFTIRSTGGVLQPIYQTGTSGSPVDNNCGSSITLTQGTTYAIQLEINWHSGGTVADFRVWMGTNGGALTQTCNLTGVSVPNDTGAYAKQGIYQGYPFKNTASTSIAYMNYRWSNTANTFSSYRTTQPALPTHP